MTTEQILTAIGFIGLGTVIPNVVNYFIQLRKSKDDSKHNLKETRYKAILVLCYSFLHYENEKDRLLLNRPDLQPLEILQRELHLEWVNMSLYASDAVIKSMRVLINDKKEASFNNLILAMRKDLYGIKTKLNAKDFHL